MRYDKLYFRARKSWRMASLVCHREQKNRDSNEENWNKNKKNKMLRRNGPVVKSVESVLRRKGSLLWERFVKEVGLESGVAERGSYWWWGWIVNRVRRCGRSRNRQVRNRQAGMRLMETVEVTNLWKKVGDKYHNVVNRNHGNNHSEILSRISSSHAFNMPKMNVIQVAFYATFKNGIFILFPFTFWMFLNTWTFLCLLFFVNSQGTFGCLWHHSN